MLSSTSNSNERIPEGPWGRTWILTLLLVPILLGVWEMGWRARGFRPSTPDDEASWVSARFRVKPSSVVFLGTSRVQVDVDPQVWRTHWEGSDPVQLAIFGASPVPFLEDLAREDTFRGLVIVDLVPRIVFDASFEREGISLERLRAFEAAKRSPAKRAEIELRQRSAPHFVFRDPALSPVHILEALRAGTLPSPPYSQMRADRFRALDFTLADTASLYQGLLKIAATHGRAATPREVDQIIGRIESAVGRIMARGGDVVMVHMPRCGGIHAVEEERYPRERYWDVLAGRTRALTVNAEDDSNLGAFPCPDGSHLDVRDTRDFTISLAEAVRRGVSARRAMGVAGDGSSPVPETEVPEASAQREKATRRGG